MLQIPEIGPPQLRKKVFSFLVFLDLAERPAGKLHDLFNDHIRVYSFFSRSLGPLYLWQITNKYLLNYIIINWYGFMGWLSSSELNGIFFYFWRIYLHIPENNPNILIRTKQETHIC